MTRAGFHIIRVLIGLTAALGASGCLLNETECGSGWTRVNGVCVPDKNAGGFYGGRPSHNIESQSPVGNDASASFENVSSKPDGALLVDAEPIRSEVDRWAEYSVVLTVDQSTANASLPVNVTAGIDLDAVLIIAPDDQVIGLAERVVEGILNPSRSATEPPQELAATLGEPDGRAISMGGNGAFVRHSMSLDRGIRTGDVVRIVDIENGEQRDEIAEVYLCKRRSIGLSDCRNLGRGDLSTISTFIVP